MKARLESPWILFPYKSLKSEKALPLKVLLLTFKLQEVASFGMLILSRDTNYSFYSCLCMIKIRTRLYE